MAEGYVPIRPGVKNGQLHRWRWGVDTFNERIDEVVVKETNGKYGIFFTQSGMNSPKNYLNYPVGTKQVKDLFDGAAYFDYPKNVRLISYLTQLGSDKDSLILDFFSGSATTAHAVMQLNAEDGGTRSWIMVQLPEATDEKSDAFKAGYKTIPEISRERIRRAGDKIAAEHPGAGVDYGFRSLRTDETNYKDVYASSSDQLQATLIDVVDNIKDDRSDLDLLYGVLTQSATPLNRSYEVRELGESKVILYDYTDRASGLVACFDATVSQETVKEISKLKPLTVVFKDASFQSSQEKVNLAEHFRITSPDTKVKVI